MILESGHSHRKVQAGKRDDNALFFGNEGGGKESNVDKRIEDKFVRISNVLKEDSGSEVDGVEETPDDLPRTVTRSREVTPVDVPEIADAPTGALFSRGNGESDNSTRDGEARYWNPAELAGTHERLTTDENSPATPEPATPADHHRDSITTISIVAQKDHSTAVDCSESASLEADERSPTALAVDPSLPSPIISARDRHVFKEVSQEVGFNRSTSPNHPGVASATKRTDLLSRELWSGSSRDGDVVDYEGATGSHENEEIAELVQRIVRQYAGYTPIMPGMPTLREMTDADTLPPEDDLSDQSTTITTVTTALATQITDAAFRPSIRPAEYALMPPPPEEIHDEVSLDDSTFVEETEATTTRQAAAVSVITSIRAS